MAKIDLYVHSKYSGRPSAWFLKRLGANESYTEHDFIYRMVKERGMDFVAVTDHNTMDGALYPQDKHPGETITGVEVTTQGLFVRSSSGKGQSVLEGGIGIYNPLTNRSRPAHSDNMMIINSFMRR